MQDLVVTIELRTESFISVLFLHLVPFLCKGDPDYINNSLLSCESALAYC